MCAQHGLWLHVDAAYGGAYACLPELSARFAEREQAEKRGKGHTIGAGVPDTEEFCCLGTGMFSTPCSACPFLGRADMPSGYRAPDARARTTGRDGATFVYVDAGDHASSFPARRRPEGHRRGVADGAPVGERDRIPL